MRLARIFGNLFSGPWLASWRFPRSAMHAIEQAIADSERTHSGEVRFAVEAALPLRHLWCGVTARERAVELFSQLRIWDTERNNGVLIYLLLAERDVEIIADRGAHALIGSASWETICRAMEAEFRADRFEAGVLLGITRITALLQQHFPPHAQGPNHNELPDAPLVL